MTLHPRILLTLKEDLGYLQADKETQARIWNRKTDIYLDFVELMCGVFDDSGFSWAVEKGKAVGMFGKELTGLLLQIGKITDRIDPYMNPTELAHLPEMEEVRRLAQEALKCPIFMLAETNSGVIQPQQRRPVGLAVGEFVVPADFDAPLPDDILNAFEGDETAARRAYWSVNIVVLRRAACTKLRTQITIASPFHD